MAGLNSDDAIEMFLIIVGKMHESSIEVHIPSRNHGSDSEFVFSFYEYLIPDLYMDFITDGKLQNFRHVDLKIVLQIVPCWKYFSWNCWNFQKLYATYPLKSLRVFVWKHHCLISEAYDGIVIFRSLIDYYFEPGISIKIYLECMRKLTFLARMHWGRKSDRFSLEKQGPLRITLPLCYRLAHARSMYSVMSIFTCKLINNAQIDIRETFDRLIRYHLGLVESGIKL